MCHITGFVRLRHTCDSPLVTETGSIWADVTFALYINVGTDLLICEDKGSFLGKDQRSSGDFFKKYCDTLLKSSGSIPDDLMVQRQLTCTILRLLINASWDKEDGKKKSRVSEHREDSQTAKTAPESL